MKFFSNEAARDNEREAGDDVRDRTETDAAVPQQRVGSPWSDAPATGTDSDADRVPADHVDLDLEDRSGAPDASHTSPVDASHASPVDASHVDASHADADRTDSPSAEADREASYSAGTLSADGDRTDTGWADSGHVDGDRVNGDRVDSDQVGTDHVGTDQVGTDHVGTDHVDADQDGDRVEGDRVGSDLHEPVAEPVSAGHDDVSTASTTTYGPDGTVTDTEEPVGSTTSTDAVKDEGTFDSPTAVEPATGESLDDDKDRVGEASTEPVVAVAAVPVTAAASDTSAAAPAGSASAPASAAAASASSSDDRLFPAGDDFVSRLREIQLGFIDGPKEATTKAAGLVDEALDKLTAALRERKTVLDDQSEDTEQLRVALRGYRDLLNRLTSL